MKKLIYTLLLLLLILLVGNFFLAYALEKIGVSYSSLHLKLPLCIEIQNLAINKKNIQIKVEHAKVDLSLRALFNGKFIGDRLLAEKVDVTIIPSNTPFSYSVIPLLDFNEVQISSADLRIQDEQDTFNLSFPDLKITNLFWNDSINIDRLTYKNGNFNFAYNSNDTITKQSGKLSIPDAVPKFKIHSLEVLKHNVFIRNQKQLTQLNNINLELQGWNNTGGADIQLKQLNFILQDTLAIDVSAKALTVQNYKGALVHALSLKVPGLELNVKELGVNETQNGKEIHVLMNRSYVSPGLIKLMDEYNSLFKPNAAPIFLEGELVYKADTLNIIQLTVNTLQRTRFKVNGRVFDVGKQNRFDLNIASFTLAANEVSNVFTAEIPKYLQNSELTGKIALNGVPSNFLTQGTFILNQNPFELNIYFHQSRNQRLLADITLSSTKFDLKKLVPDFEQDLLVYKLLVNSTLDLGKISQENKFDIHLKSDSLFYKNNKMVHPELNLSFKNNTTDLWVESAEQNWKLFLTAQGDILKSEDLHFNGYAYVHNLAAIVKGYPTGLLSTSFTGEVIHSIDSLYIELGLDKLLLTSKNGKKNDFQASRIKFLKKLTFYSFSISKDTNTIFKTEFTEDFISWIKKPNRSIFPDVYLYSKFEIDSSMSEQFVGAKIHLNLNNLEIRSVSNKITGTLDIPLISFGSLYLKDLKGNLNYMDEKKEANLQIGHILNSYLNLDSVQSNLTSNSIDSLTYQFRGKVPSINQNISLSGNFNILPKSYQICFAKQNSFQLGSQNWQYIDGTGIFINKETKGISGNLQFANEEQRIRFSENSDAILLNLDSINLGPVADIFVKDFNLDARLSFRAAYREKAEEFSLKGELKNIELDSISLGNTTFSGNINPAQFNFDTRLVSNAWAVELKAKKTNDDSEIEVKIDQLNLSKLDSIFHLVSSDFELSGSINGDAKVVGGKTNKTEGLLKFEKVQFKMKDYGTEANIDKQQIQLSDHYLRFNNFIITDVDHNELQLNGKLGLNESDQNLLSLVSKKFLLFTNNKPSAVTKGKLEIESDLLVSGGFNNLSVSGNLNLLKGGSINHYYKSGVSLTGTNEDVVFLKFNEYDEKKFIPKRAIRQFPINWNVNMNIGSTEVYILLDKTKHDYVKLMLNGELQLRKGKEIMPQVFGNIISTQGNVYYDLPIVSDVEMKILLAKAQWNGDLKNPILNFKGVETFRVTPNEMSSQLPDKKNRVPVDVTAEIENKTLKNFELNFDIYSSNADVQNILSALPAETKESYAINMLLFGKVNTDSKSAASGMSAIVSKLNEISRRNIKNAELSFNVNNNSESDDNVNTEATRIGYDFSKGFFNEKFKVSLGGNFDLGSTPAASKSSPLGTIQLEYVLKEEPNITLQLKRENSYRGPIEGQVDESGISLNFNKKFKNLFRTKKAISKNSKK